MAVTSFQVEERMNGETGPLLTRSLCLLLLHKTRPPDDTGQARDSFINYTWKLAGHACDFLIEGNKQNKVSAAMGPSREDVVDRKQGVRASLWIWKRQR